MDAGQLGHTGEAIAAKYYLERGFTLLAHNYQTRQGELDIVLQKQDLVVICEVKTRAGAQLGTPAEAVTLAKQKRLILAAKQYLQQYGLLEHFIRFDVAEVTPQGDTWLVHCIPNAFSAEESLRGRRF